MYYYRHGEVIFASLLPDLPLRHSGIADESVPVQVLPVHVHGGDLPVIVGGVVVDPPVRVPAGGVQGHLIGPVRHLAAAALLLHGAQDVKHLAHALPLSRPGQGVQPGKRGPDKSGLAGQIPGESHAAHAPAV